MTPIAPPPTPALPPAALPSSRLTFIKDHFGINIPITNPLLTPAALLICAVRFEAVGTDTPLATHRRPTTPFAEWGPGRGSEQYEHDWMRILTCYSPWDQPMIRRRVFTPGMITGAWVGRVFVRCCRLECVLVPLTFVFFKEIPREQFDFILNPLTPYHSSPLIQVYSRPMQFYLW
jgi:hypothetical protein